jgi:hypothetical protein
LYAITDSNTIANSDISGNGYSQCCSKHANGYAHANKYAFAYLDSDTNADSDSNYHAHT